MHSKLYLVSLDSSIFASPCSHRYHCIYSLHSNDKNTSLLIATEPLPLRQLASFGACWYENRVKSSRDQSSRLCDNVSERGEMSKDPEDFQIGRSSRKHLTMASQNEWMIQDKKADLDFESIG